MRLLIVGAGGHAKVVLEAAVRLGFEIAGVIGQPGRATELLGFPISGDMSGIDADGFIAATGDNASRARTYEECLARGLEPTTVVHPSAVIGDDVTLGAGTFVAAGVVVNVGVWIGENAVLNTGCTIDHDCRIGDHAHVGPGASLCGGVQVGSGALVGVGSSVVPCACIGEWSVVGAGAAVVGDLPAEMICTGVPARPVRAIEARS